MNITRNTINQPCAAPKVGFKSREDVDFLKKMLKSNSRRVKEFAENGIFSGMTKQELESREVLDAFEKAKSKQIFQGGRDIIDKAYAILMKPFLQK